MNTLYKFDKENQMFLSNIIELYPTEEQKEKIYEYIVTTNYMYDIIISWMDDKYIQYMSEESYGKYLSLFDCGRMVKEYRVTDSFISEIPLSVLTEVYSGAIYAYRAFIDRRANHPVKHYPDNMRMGFSLEPNASFYIKNGYVTLPGFAPKSSKGKRVGSIKCQNIGLDTSKDTIYNVSIYIDNFGKYYLYYTYIVNRYPYNYPKTGVVGIDLGYRLDGCNTIVCSNADIYHLPQVEHLINRVRNFQSLYESKRAERLLLYPYDPEQHISNKEIEYLNKFRVAHRKLYDSLDTFYNQATIDIIKKNPEAIVIEDCFAAELKRNSKHNLIKYGVTSAGKIREMLIYKAKLHKIPIYVADRNFKSSYICSRCLCINQKNLKQKKIFKCETCGYEIDRDLNAAINLANIYNFKDYPLNYNHCIKEIIM